MKPVNATRTDSLVRLRNSFEHYKQMQLEEPGALLFPLLNKKPGQESGAVPLSEKSNRTSKKKMKNAANV